MKKIKVDVAAQVYNRSMATFISTTCQYDSGITTSAGTFKMPKEAAAYASLAFLIDGAFNSMNGASDKKNTEKPMLNAVDKNSGHIEFWSKVREIFSKIHFIKDKET